MGVSLKFNMPSITPKFTFRLLVLVFWSQFTILKFVSEAIERLPFISWISSFFVPFLFISLFALSLPYIFRRVRIPDILFAFLVVLVVVMTLLIYTESMSYISVELWRIFGLGLPLYFVGVIYDHEDTKRDLFWCSLVGVFVMFIYQLYVLATGRALETENMSASYNVLPSIMYLIYWAVSNKGIKNWIIAISASLVAFIFGTRGPILVIAIFMGIGIIYKVIKMENLFIRILIITIVIVSVSYVTSGDLMVKLALSLSEKFGEMGFSTRIFDFIIEDQIAESEGRKELSEAVWEAIKQKPIVGYGFMGDRAIVSPYVHNIILEYLCSYGVILGSIITVLTVLIPTVAVVRIWGSSNSWLIVMLMCMVFGKLMFSGSYVYESYFYMLLGLSVNTIRTNKVLFNNK